MSSSKQIPRAPRYESLDVLRGLACLAVVLHHAPGRDRSFENISFLTNRLWIGVQLFFVISGYCIAATCDSAGRHERSFLWYMKRRIRRIHPPYWAALIFALGVYYAGMAAPMGEISCPDGLSASDWLSNWTLIPFWQFQWIGGAGHYVLRVAWTLWYEEQFYLVCGMLLLIARGHFFAGIVAISALSLPLTILTWSGTVNFHGWFYDGYWFQFAAGVLVYYGRNYAGLKGRRYCIGVLAAALAIAVTLRLALPQEIVNHLSRAAFLDGSTCAFGLAAILLAFEKWDAVVATAHATSPLRYLGARCYSLYLTHPASIDIVRFSFEQLGWSNASVLRPVEAIVTIVGCLVGAVIFYRLVEVRFLNTPQATSAESEKTNPPANRR